MNLRVARHEPRRSFASHAGAAGVILCAIMIAAEVAKLVDAQDLGS